MMGYVLTAFLLATSGLYFLALDLGYGMTDFSYYTLYRTIFILLLYIPVLTMRSFAEERRARTDQLLLTSPVSVWEIVVGKFFAMAVIFAIPLPRGCRHDFDSLGAGQHHHGTGGQLRGPFMLFSAGLCGHRHRGSSSPV